ncbi:hypothetical protein LEP1GSC057_3522 [Leptospira interrogans str. Brem 329]|nr:hypothetical protein LEP1GSC057_3522 [Leptospira interrogans str. Brem 329]
MGNFFSCFTDLYKTECLNFYRKNTVSVQNIGYFNMVPSNILSRFLESFVIKKVVVPTFFRNQIRL